MSSYSPALVLMMVVSLALAPFVAVMVTSFTKIVVVLSLLRNALGLQQVPPNVVINGLAIVLSIYVMYPVILDTNAAIRGQPPVTTATTASPALRQNRPPAATAATPAPAATAAATAPLPPTASPNDPPPQSPAAAAAVAAEAQAQASAATAATRGAQFQNVRGTTDGATSAPAAVAQGATPAPPLPNASTAPLAADASGTAATAGAGTGTTGSPSLLEGRMDAAKLLAIWNAGKEPLRAFLIQHSKDAERAFFLRSAQRLLPPARRGDIGAEDFIVVIPAFTVSELTAAFQIGFLIYLPFLIIDLVVSNILLALGMMMMSPTTVSLPFKLLLFVLIDGWAKLVHGLVLTYGS